MRTEYMFTDAQKARIEQIHNQILALNAELASICAMTPVRYITEHEDEVDALRHMYEQYYYMIPGECKLEGVAKIIGMDEQNNGGGCI